jgi:hypothetical protein
MEPNTLTVKYGVELTGDQFDHEAFREAVAEIDGAEIVAEMDEEGYFEVADAE